MRGAALLPVLLLTIVLAGAQTAVPAATGPEGVAPDRVLVRYREGPPQTPSLLAGGTGSTRYVPLLNVWGIDLPPAVSVDDALAGLRADPAVEFAQPSYTYTSARAPDDPMYREAQHPYYAVINAPAGWDVETGDASVVVAVLDGGVDTSHTELDDHIWTNAGETANGFDDDGNGCIDDITGCNLLSDPPDGDIGDRDGHGTFVSGIIAAESDNGVGVTGVAWDATIMPVRVLAEGGIGETEQLAAGILYAAQNGAQIENLSLALLPQGSTCPTDPIVEEAVRRAHDDFGTVVVAAAGNFNLGCVAFPASSQYTIAVGASGPPTDPDTRAFFSQWGPEVDVAAPGIGIVSASPGESYSTNLGTSFSTPIVAGLAALLLAQDPSRTNEDVRRIIRETARDLPDDQHANWDGAGLTDVGAALGVGAVSAFVDARGPRAAALSFSVAVGDPDHPSCQSTFWDRPEVSGDRVRGTFGVGECAAYWPPAPDRPWFLRSARASAKAAALEAWALSSAGLSCAAAGLPVFISRGPPLVSRIDCNGSGDVIANDTPPAALVLDAGQLPQHLQQDVRHATASTSDPGPSCLGGIEFSRSVWYRLPPAGEPQALAADTFGSDFATVLAVYRGDPSGQSEVACNARFGSTQSRVVWRADGASDYYLMAAAFQKVPAGDLSLNISRASVPANDEPARPLTIGPSDQYLTVQPAHSATSSVDDPSLTCRSTYGFSLWFRLVSTQDETLTLSTGESDYDTIIGVLRPDENGWTEVGCNDDVALGDRTSRVSWEAAAGREYMVVVGAFPGQTGGVLRLRFAGH